jgi:hypothetical protein
VRNIIIGQKYRAKVINTRTTWPVVLFEMKRTCDKKKDMYEDFEQ